MEKEKYTEPKLEVLFLDCADIVTSSDTAFDGETDGFW